MSPNKCSKCGVFNPKWLFKIEVFSLKFSDVKNTQKQYYCANCYSIEEFKKMKEKIKSEKIRTLPGFEIKATLLKIKNELP